MLSSRKTPPVQTLPLHSTYVNGVQLQGEFMGGPPDVIRPAKVWAVDPKRGDLYVVHLSPRNSQLVQLVDGGIVDDSHKVMNMEMYVKCDLDGNVIALPYENCLNSWSRCVPLGTSPDAT